MSKAFKIVLIISVLLLIPFVYFWIRDVPSLSSEEEGEKCNPYDITTEVDRFSAELSWKTESECVSYLKYSLNANGDNWTTVTSEEEFRLKTEHSVLIDDLKPGTDYYVTVISEGETYGENNNPLKIRTED